MVLPYLAWRARAISPSFCVMVFHSLSTSPGKTVWCKLLVERELAGQEAAVERGQRELEIVGIELAGFFHRPRAGAGAQADIPHALDDRPHRFPRLLLGLLVGEGKEHVDIGIGEEILASVAAQRQQRYILRRLAGKRPAPHFNQDAVHHCRAPPDRSRAVPGTLAGLADKRHLPEILIPKIVNR